MNYFFQTLDFWKMHMFFVILSRQIQDIYFLVDNAVCVQLTFVFLRYGYVFFFVFLFLHLGVLPEKLVRGVPGSTPI